MKFNPILLAFSLLLMVSEAAPAVPLSATRPLPPGAFTATTEPQRLTLLSSGMSSLRKRLQLIESATQSIETEFYIYQSDHAGRLYTQALIEKARSGVHVRILMDHGLDTRNLNPFEARVLAENGIEVRYYNDTPLIQFNKANNRSHRKSLIVDGTRAIIGGRNLADDFFEFSSEYNMLDEDILVEGSLTASILESFESFWNSTLSKPAETVSEPTLADYGLDSDDTSNMGADDLSRLRKFRQALKDYKELQAKAKDFIEPSKQDLAMKSRISFYGDLQLAEAPSGICNETYYFSDLPGHKKDARVVYDQIAQYLGTAQKTLQVESPFFIKTEPESLFKQALDRGVKVDVLTNSLFSADVALSIAPFFTYAKELTTAGANVYVFEGDGPKWRETVNPTARQARWGTHAKTIVIDEDSFLVGSFNMDPRSANLNAEMALVCRNNPQMAAALAKEYEVRKSIAVKLNRNADPVDGRTKYFNVDQNKKFIFFLTRPFAHLFDFLL